MSASTASGKTLIAVLAMLGHLSKKNSKIVYLSPLRALASEKFLEFKKLEGVRLKNKARVAISTGDFENVTRGLEKSNILVLTNERMDSLIRHGTEWISEIGLVIADEIHLIGDPYRGSTLEMVLTQLKLETGPQIVGLSATITNSDEIADWLGCKLVKTDWRPVPLSEGVCSGGKAVMGNGETFKVERSMRGASIDLGVQSIKSGGQSLVFANTRASSKTLAVKAADVVSKMLKKGDAGALKDTSKKILTENENTEMVKTLAQLVKKGVAFHHAGLNQNCRTAIETEFRRGTIKLLSSTPTLAAGVNLPARRVIISNINRYDAQAGGNKPISVLEYKQLCGRAGRPQYDDFGESIIVANTSREEITDRYINGEPEPIVSSMTDAGSLKIHVLSVVVTNPGITKDGILDFFMHTLGGLQSRKATVKFAVGVSLRFLAGKDLVVNKGERYAATEFGKKTSLLYIDPATATGFRDAIEEASEGKKHTLGYLHLISACKEFFPKLYLRPDDYWDAETLIDSNYSGMLELISAQDCSRSLLALHRWITESSELSISDQLGVESGDMHRIVENADWLSYCLREITKHVGRADLLGELEDLRTRIKYGVKENLIDLVKVRGIGRVRARMMYKKGIHTLDDLRETPASTLAKIDKIGPTLAASIKSELKRVR